jgi:type IV pilus assembly protein PilM
MKLGKKKEEEVVGIDIGSHSIKVISLKKDSEQNTLNVYNIKKLPQDKKQIEIANIIQESLKEVDLSPEVVNLAISGPDVIVRFIILPKMTKEQLESALVFEAEKYIPFNVNEVVLDFIILGDAPESGQMRVLLAAAKKEPVEFMVKTIADLGMTVGAIDISAFAMFNAFIESHDSLEEKGVALIDFGHSHTDVLISAGKTPHFMRQIQIGGRDINVALSRNTSIALDKAEEYKLGAEGADKEEVTQAMQQVLDDIVKEIQLSFGYFENSSNIPISEIYCSGGMIEGEGFIEYFNSKMGVEIKRWNPIEGVNVSEYISREDIDSIASRLAVSLGLALRG